MVIISLINQKGGCGKTTTAVNLSYALAETDKKVLLIDLDPQGNAAFSLGIKSALTTTDLFDYIITNKPIKINNFLTKRCDNLYVLGSSIGLSAIEQTLAHREDKLNILKDFFAQNNMSFDYCIIDCPPNVGVLTLNALLSSRYVIAPIGVCVLSLNGVENLHNIIHMLSAHNKNIPSLYYLITQWDQRFRFSKSFYKKTQELFGTKLLSTAIRTNIHLREAAASGMSIFEYKKDARGSRDYGQLAEEINNMIQRNKETTYKEVRFSLNGTDFNEVYLVGEFNNWQKNNRYRLKKTALDAWRISLPLAKGKYNYKFIVDNRWVNDPNNTMEENDSFGGKNSVVTVS